jgi:dCMP deaminase
MNKEWDVYFMDMARLVASKSKDPSTQVGCVIIGLDKEVRSTGFNGIPRNVADSPYRMQRPEKYEWFCHAEENAIAHAALAGISLKGGTAYSTLHPCNVCTRMLIQAGVDRVVSPLGEIPERWKPQFTIAKAMMTEAGVQFDQGMF